jgi:hypothetical protein
MEPLITQPDVLLPHSLGTVMPLELTVGHALVLEELADERRRLPDRRLLLENVLILRFLVAVIW